MKRLMSFVSLAVVLFSSTSAIAQQAKPNILVIMGDDIGWFNPSCYNSGIMGYRTPNIDRIATEGLRRPAGTSGTMVPLKEKLTHLR